MLSVFADAAKHRTYPSLPQSRLGCSRSKRDCHSEPAFPVPNRHERSAALSVLICSSHVHSGHLCRASEPDSEYDAMTKRGLPRRARELQYPMDILIAYTECPVTYPSPP